MNRRTFGLSLASCAAVAGASAVGATPVEPSSEAVGDDRTNAALVLTGGGARGAYEAGVIEGLRRRAGIRDGTPLPDADVVCGASIGALNGWFVATAQYDALRSLWRNVAAEEVFAVKRRFAAPTRPSSGIGTRIAVSLELFRGLLTNVTGILDGGRIAAWLDRHVDPRTPMVTPLVFTATNLDTQRADVFYRLAALPDPNVVETVTQRIRSVVGAAEVRVAQAAILRSALQASAAIPVLCDPVVIPGDAAPASYVDGGIADNTPVDLARALARSVRAVFVDPLITRPPHRNALEIALAAFGTAQRRVLEASLRSAQLETEGKRLFPPSNAAQRTYFRNVFDVELFAIRPASDLALEVTGFSDQIAIDVAYAHGVEDGQRGWRTFPNG